MIAMMNKKNKNVSSTKMKEKQVMAMMKGKKEEKKKIVA
jgi:hypothetical protein